MSELKQRKLQKSYFAISGLRFECNAPTVRSQLSGLRATGLRLSSLSCGSGRGRMDDGQGEGRLLRQPTIRHGLSHDDDNILFD